VPVHQEARPSAAGAVTWRKVSGKFPLDLQDACILIGLSTVVAGIALLSVAGALIVGGALLVVLAIMWPSKKGA
jgi:hypothetical protein